MSSNRVLNLGWLQSKFSMANRFGQSEVITSDEAAFGDFNAPLPDAQDIGGDLDDPTDDDAPNKENEGND